MGKYLLQKYEIYRHQMCFFKLQMHQNRFSAAPPLTPVGGAYDSPDSYSAGES